jgi:hypothetical protein
MRKYIDTIWKIMTIAGFGLVLGTNILLAYWLLRPYEVYTFDQPYQVMNEVVKPGDKLQIRQTFCKLIKAPATLEIYLVDGFYETLRTIQSNTEIGCYENISQSVVIPPYTQEGEYKIVYNIRVRVNPVRQIDYTVETESFRVVH